MIKFLRDGIGVTCWYLSLFIISSSLQADVKSIVDKPSGTFQQWLNKLVPVPPASVVEKTVHGSMKKVELSQTREQKAEKAYKKAMALASKDNLPEAIDILVGSLAAAPDYFPNREALIIFLIKSGRQEEAKEMLVQGLKEYSNYPDFSKLLARIYLEEGKRDKAIAVLVEGITPELDDEEYFALVAVLYQKQGKYEKSASIYRRLVKTNENEGKYWLGLGIALDKMKRYDAARLAYQKAISDQAALRPDMRRFANKRIVDLKKG